MPKPTTKKRQELRSVFSTNAIPTERDYADLIAAGLNQADDGIVKLPDQPLGLVRQKPPASATTASAPSAPSAPSTASSSTPAGVLNFFGEPEDASPSWQLQLIGTNRPGFALADQDGTSRLFLDGTTGNLGVGTTTPAQRLTVEGPWGGSSKDSTNTLADVGQLAIKGTKAQLDFVVPGTDNDWAIQNENGTLTFFRSPWQDFASLSIDKDADKDASLQYSYATFKSNVIRRVFATSGRGEFPFTWTNSIPHQLVPGRSLTVRKRHKETVLRILYHDNFQVPLQGDHHCRWEVKLAKGNVVKSEKGPSSLQFGPLSNTEISSSITQGTAGIPGSIMGYTIALDPGYWKVEIHVRPTSQNGQGRTGRGSGDILSTYSLEVEEVFLNYSIEPSRY